MLTSIPAWALLNLWCKVISGPQEASYSFVPRFLYLNINCQLGTEGNTYFIYIMKKSYLTLVVSLFSCFLLYGKEQNVSEDIGVIFPEVSVQVDVPGTLGVKILETGKRPNEVGKLTVKGTLNDDDWKLISTNMPLLNDLNLKGITNTTMIGLENKLNLFTIVLPDNLEVLSGLYGCEKLNSITLPAGLKKISDYACSGCSSLYSIKIPEGTTHIGRLAFGNCTSLTDVQLPSTVQSIYDGAFASTKIQEIVLPQALDTLGGHYDERWWREASPFYNDNSWYYSADEAGVFTNCAYLKNIVIPSKIKKITGGTFTGCSQLTSVSLPEGLQYIGYSAFAGCKALKTIKLPESLLSLESSFTYSGLQEIEIPVRITNLGSSFKDCTSLHKITLPAGLTTTNSAFNKNTPIRDIICKGKVPANLQGSGLEEDIKSITVTVPRGYKIAYLVAPIWGNCYDVVEADGLLEQRSLTVNFNENITVLSNSHALTNGAAITMDRCDHFSFSFDKNENEKYVYYIDSLMFNGKKVLYSDFYFDRRNETVDISYFYFDERYGSYPMDNPDSFVFPMLVDNSVIDITFAKYGAERYDFELKKIGSGDAYYRGYEIYSDTRKVISGEQTFSFVPHDKNHIVTEVLYNGKDVTSQLQSEVVDLYDNGVLYTVSSLSLDITGNSVLSVKFGKPANGINDIRQSEVMVRAHGQNIHIYSDNPEEITIYSLYGQLLNHSIKGVGEEIISLPFISDKIVIVKGGSGWVRKIIR